MCILVLSEIKVSIGLSVNLICGCLSGVNSNPIKGFSCFLWPETLPYFLSTGWVQEQIWVWFYNQTKIKKVSTYTAGLKALMVNKFTLIRSKQVKIRCFYFYICPGTDHKKHTDKMCWSFFFSFIFYPHFIFMYISFVIIIYQ